MLLHENQIFTDIHKIQSSELSFPVADVFLLKECGRNTTFLQYSILTYTYLLHGAESLLRS